MLAQVLKLPLATLSLNQRQQRAPATFADDRIAFPVAVAVTEFDDVGPAAASPLRPPLGRAA